MIVCMRRARSHARVQCACPLLFATPGRKICRGSGAKHPSLSPEVCGKDSPRGGRHNHRGERPDLRAGNGSSEPLFDRLIAPSLMRRFRRLLFRCPSHIAAEFTRQRRALYSSAKLALTRTPAAHTDETEPGHHCTMAFGTDTRCCPKIDCYSFTNTAAGLHTPHAPTRRAHLNTQHSHKHFGTT
ncbi:unnamed protein product [Trichogramma brassicae]|uniref:Uncharacterized protein n=1 Tax=Trichogramma brassicae TaxID=86971 RepID=A0A6H5IY08_9HYME|nr:unnamed protein product [Trichogramma brassicae]